MQKMILAIMAGVIGIGMSSNCASPYREDEMDSTYLDYGAAALGYEFYNPDVVLDLDKDLDETSALSYYSDDLLVTVEDENGYIYFISTADGSIQRKVKFAKDQDYEGVEVVDDKVFVIESGGDLYSFNLGDKDEVDAEKDDTTFGNKNNVEGLGYDGKDLLIACKGSGDIDGNNVKGKAVYRYNIEEQKVHGKEIIDVEEDDIDDFIKEREYFNNVSDYDPSGVAVHPITSDIYLLSADDVLVVFDEGEIKEVVPLDSELYPQPEGICFAPDGTLYISSESKGGPALLLKIRYNK